MEIKDFIDNAGKLERVDLYDGFVQLYISPKLNGATIIACGDNVLKDEVFDKKEDAIHSLEIVDYSIIASFVYKLVDYYIKQEKHN